MKSTFFEIESKKQLSKSKIWQLNRDFYNFYGIGAFSEDIVPHHLTSNAFVGKTYAELIFGFLKDLADQGESKDTVHILELGAGHGRLAFHILTHLESLIDISKVSIPPFCYILSDIVEANLAFFEEHPKFKKYFDKGLLDVSYFDAEKGEDLYLRKAKVSIEFQTLSQPLIAIANYFFDSIPTDLFAIKSSRIFASLLSLESDSDPVDLNPKELIEQIEVKYHHSLAVEPFYENAVINEVLEDYKRLLSDTNLFFPELAMQCIESIKQLSKQGLFLISMDKGFHEIQDLEGRKEPDMVKHGSFSIWVNFHALASFCKKLGGKAMLPAFSSFHLDLGALLFLDDASSYHQTIAAHKRSVDDFGPDDFNSLKKLTYHNITRLNTKDLLALIRLSVYDSTFFVKLLPRLKQVSKDVTMIERRRIAEMMHIIWNRYFSIGERYDIAYEIGGYFYDLGFYKDALIYFDHSVDLHGMKPDIFYNKALTYYQLREDKLFKETIIEGKKAFPDHEIFKDLEKLDLR